QGVDVGPAGEGDGASGERPVGQIDGQGVVAGATIEGERGQPVQRHRRRAVEAVGDVPESAARRAHHDHAVVAASAVEDPTAGHRGGAAGGGGGGEALVVADLHAKGNAAGAGVGVRAADGEGAAAAVADGAARGAAVAPGDDGGVPGGAAERVGVGEG